MKKEAKVAALMAQVEAACVLRKDISAFLSSTLRLSPASFEMIEEDVRLLIGVSTTDNCKASALFSSASVGISQPIFFPFSLSGN